MCFDILRLKLMIEAQTLLKEIMSYFTSGTDSMLHPEGSPAKLKPGTTVEAGQMQNSMIRGTMLEYNFTN
jgi:hypothetical protein